MNNRFIKLTLLILLLPLMGQMRAQAQEDKWRFSVHFDPGINWFFVDNALYKNSGAGFSLCAGAEVELVLVERVSLLSGLSYDLRYATLEYRTGDYQLKMAYEDDPYNLPEGAIVKTEAQFLKIPIGIKMRAIQIGYFTITASLGLSGSVLVSQRASSPTINVDKGKTKGMFNWGLVGYFFRVGTEYSLGGRSALEAGLGYYGTFTSIYHPGRGGVGYHNLGFRLGFVF